MLILLAAIPAFGQLRLDRLTIYYTGVETLSGRKQLGSLAEVTYIGSSGNPTSGQWKTIHGFEDAFNGAVAASTGIRFSSGPTWRSTFTMLGQYSTCYRARAIAEVDGTFDNSWGSNHLCTPARQDIVPPPCEFTPEGCGGGVPVNCPLIVNPGRGPWRLSGLDDPVSFDIDGDGVRDRMGWTERGSRLAFVTRDRNGNGVIDDVQELFGDSTLLASGTSAGTGFSVLKELDTNGDGIVNASDPAWQTLSLWTDANHDALTQPGELQPIRATSIEGLSTHYHRTGRVDQHGNEFRLKSLVFKASGREPYYDIFFRVDR